jgi:hypothetical protein
MEARYLTPKAVVAVFALLIPQSAKAVDPGCDAVKACNDIVYCAYTQLDPTNNTDRTNLLSGLDRDNGKDIKDAVDKCQTHYGHHDSYKANLQGCDPERAQLIGRDAKKTHCGALFQPPPPPPGQTYYCRINGKVYPLGSVALGFGICNGPSTVGAPCDCGGKPGQVQ